MAQKYEGSPCRRCGGTIRYKSNKHCINTECCHTADVHLYQIREVLKSAKQAEEIVIELKRMLLR